jgi:2-polyprenyl-6-hydroxyphenyl methylase/3-demethylubiquinone-9 3-methyltransferase
MNANRTSDPGSGTHFAFGENWRAYAEKIDERTIQEAINGLRRLVGGHIAGKRFLDIGCGSGLHALAALRLGAVEVYGVDVDSDSVATAQRVLAQYAPAGSWLVEQRSVFDITTVQVDRFDVVYSWGVLHHTGDMRLAIRRAAELVAPDGLLVLAVYRKTWLCPFWKWEKRWYAQTTPRWQTRGQRIYRAVLHMRLWATGQTYSKYVANYRANRGMDLYHDVHDWMGGWPYESISPPEVERLMEALGLEHVRSFVTAERHVWGKQIGLLGSGCDEYVYRRV